MNSTGKTNNDKSFLNNYFKARSSIYGQVVYVITILSVFLFLSFGAIFRSVNERYMRRVIRQTGSNIGFLVEGSLYQSMLENDKMALKNTLEIIKEMPDIDDIGMYDHFDSLVYSSCSSGNAVSSSNCNINCKECHSDIRSLFSGETESYKVLDKNSKCEMNKRNRDHRHLLVNRTILNEPSCYTNECHVHEESDKVLGSLVVNIPLGDLDGALQESSTDFYIMATIMTILLLSFLIIFTRKKIKAPLGDIIKASQAVANGDTSKRLEVKHNQLDDMRMVSYAFNNMLDNLNSVTNELQNWSQQLEYKVQKKTEELKEAHNELINAERMASLGRLSSSVAHEINNPLAGVLTYTKLVQKQLSRNDLDEAKKENLMKHLKMIESETKRCGDIVKGLLDFSRKDQLDFEIKSFHIILKETFELMTHPMKMADIAFHTNFTADHDLIKCAPNQIKQACIAILVNAKEAITEHGEIVMKTSNPDNQNITLDITDNGSGISEEDLPHVFEPFFSKKQKASGIGLGLAIVHGIIQNHKGKVDVESLPGKYTTISITLPLIIE